MQKLLNVFTKGYFVLGLILALLGIYWITKNIDIFYNYHFTNLLYNFMYPEWVLGVDIIIGIITFILGLKIIGRSMNILNAYVLFSILLLIVILLDNLSVR